MKSLVLAFAASLLSVASCTREAATPSYYKEVAILIDDTDSLRRYPDADIIAHYMKLYEEPWLGSRIAVSVISDNDMNPANYVSIPPENALFGNSEIRKATITKAKKRLAEILDSVSTVRKGRSHSVIYRTIARHLNRLAESKATMRACFIYSDFMENESVSFLDPAIRKLLVDQPGRVSINLLSQCPLADLRGISIFGMYRPRDYEDNQRVMPAFLFFGRLWESKGAKVEMFMGLKG
jgi:hypothetical protein